MRDILSVEEFNNNSSNINKIITIGNINYIKHLLSTLGYNYYYIDFKDNELYFLINLGECSICSSNTLKELMSGDSDEYHFIPNEVISNYLRQFKKQESFYGGVDIVRQSGSNMTITADKNGLYEVRYIDDDDIDEDNWIDDMWENFDY